VKLQLISCNSRETVKKICANQADVGIIAGVCELPEIKNTVIDLEDFVLVTTKEILAQHELPVVLERYPFISFKEGCNLEGYIGRGLAEINYIPSSVIECSSEETIKRAVLNQTGVALLSTALIQKELESGALIELHRFSQKAETSLICLKNRADEAVIQTFSELVTDVWKSVRE
jgi:DNA-binding transcriptional LysR family regulator